MESDLALGESAVSAVPGMNRSVVARRGAPVQQGLFTQLSERLAGRRRASCRLAARPAVNDVNSARPRRPHERG